MIVAALAQALLPTVLGPRFEADEQPPNVLQPASATFAVWLPIFATSLWHARVQGLPRHVSDPVLGAVSGPAAVAYAATGLWAPLVRSRRYWPAQVALFVVAAAAEVARRRVAAAQSERSISGPAGRVLTPPIGMLSAWGAAASAVNLGAMLVGEGPVSEGRPATLTGVVLTAATTTTALVAAATSPGGSVIPVTRTYLATVAWALGGIVAGQRRRSPAVAATAAVGLLAVGGALGTGRRFVTSHAR